MSYTIYFKYGSKRYKLPVNPEEIKRSREMQIETYQVLGTGQVSIPSRCELETFSFEAEFPSQEYSYVETAGQFKDADYYEKMFRKAQKNMVPIRFIASNRITDDISYKVLVKSVEAVEKAGEEGDKYLSKKPDQPSSNRKQNLYRGKRGYIKRNCKKVLWKWFAVSQDCIG